jgi:signal transduction histidine kinase
MRARCGTKLRTYAAIKAREDMVAVVSHDLHSPLNVIAL